jgi:hypothetical protein
MEFYYNFTEKQQVNPLEKYTHFFINPYMIDSFAKLRLAEKMEGKEDEINVNIRKPNGLPVIIIPLNLLELDNVHVNMQRDGFIVTKRLPSNTLMRIYMKFTDENHLIRIDSVLIS